MSSDLVPGAAATWRRRWLLALVSLASIGLPFLLVDIPPITDLAQHVAQVPLFVDAISNPDTPYRVQWMAPYGVSYLVLGLAWLVGGAKWAGSIGAALIAMLWGASLHALAAARGRDPAAALLGSVLALGVSLHWGFLPFLAGFPLFLVWLQRTQRSEREAFDRREWLVLTSLATLVYLTHALWFAAACIWLAGAGLFARLRLSTQFARLATLLPSALLGLYWIQFAEQRGFASPMAWGRGPAERFDPVQIAHSVLGGVKGLESVGVFLVLLFWILGGALGFLGANRRRNATPAEGRAASPDWRLLGAGLLLMVAALALPAKLMNTIDFERRWWAPAMALLALGAPSLAVHSRTIRIAVVALVIAVSSGVAIAWRNIERFELRGLEASLTALPPLRSDQNLMGLDYVRRSAFRHGESFLQMFAYAQVRRGGSLSQSFADFPTAPVIYRERRPPTWTPNLLWKPLEVRRSDFLAFDYVLVNAPVEMLDEFDRRAPIEAMTRTDPWRLYRVRKNLERQAGPSGPSAE